MLRATLNAAQNKQLSEGNLMMRPDLLKLKGTPPWRTAGEVRDCPANAEYRGYVAEKYTPDANEKRTLRCKGCNTRCDMTGKNTYDDLAWKSFDCMTCRKKKNLKYFVCDCGKHLYQCERHSSENFEKCKKDKIQIPKKKTLKKLKRPEAKQCDAPEAKRCDAPYSSPIDTNNQYCEALHNSIVAMAERAETDGAARSHETLRDASRSSNSYLTQEICNAQKVTLSI